MDAATRRELRRDAKVDELAKRYSIRCPRISTGTSRKEPLLPKDLDSPKASGDSPRRPTKRYKRIDWDALVEIPDRGLLTEADRRRLRETNRGGEPELKLMKSILLDALKVVRVNIRRRSQAAEAVMNETILWFCNDEADYPLSFLNICRTLELDAATILHWIEKTLEEEIEKQ
jgi:hypothetical protein